MNITEAIKVKSGNNNEIRKKLPFYRNFINR